MGANEGGGFASKLPPVLLSALTGMDEGGETILGTYLYGGGKPRLVYDDEYWTPYMMANTGLRQQLQNRLIFAMRAFIDNLVCRVQRSGKFPIQRQFHAECPENSGFSGYALLHGTNSAAGDFRMFAWAEVDEPGADGAFDIGLDLRFTFNDIVDPNGHYAMDSIRSKFADIFTLGLARPYQLSISWPSTALVSVQSNGDFTLYGYPAKAPIPLRPLPKATLDWVGENKKYAEKIEAKMIAQLQRNLGPNDVAGLTDRKRRLLWLAYRLSGYISSIYIARLTGSANSGDVWRRLINERLSGALQAELLAAIRGAKPAGPEPE